MSTRDDEMFQAQFACAYDTTSNSIRPLWSCIAAMDSYKTFRYEMHHHKLRPNEIFATIQIVRKSGKVDITMLFEDGTPMVKRKIPTIASAPDPSIPSRMNSVAGYKAFECKSDIRARMKEQVGDKADSLIRHAPTGRTQVIDKKHVVHVCKPSKPVPTRKNVELKSLKELDTVFSYDTRTKPRDWNRKPGSRRS
ncbi:MAG: hypothetical protein RR382_02445 [Tannerellaceae bacterium]